VLLPTFVEKAGKRRPNPKLEHLLSLERGRRSRFTTPGRIEVVEKLDSEGMLPAICFVFSRAGCDGAALQVLESGLRLVGAEDRARIREVAEERTSHLSDRDLAALDYGRWISTLEAGAAAHHAGMVPAFKETVESLFAEGLLKVVFATETLALGINMPARTVVLESLSKFDGEGHSLLEPGDYTQLTGRAGRRGIDTRGYGVVLHSRFVRFDQVARIASIGSHPLRSSFRPTYNMAANLVANYAQDKAEELLESSFAQFQRQGSHTAGEKMLAEMSDRLLDERARAECELGSVDEYAGLVEATSSEPGESLIGRLHPGDVIDLSAGPRAGRHVVLRRLARGKQGIRLLVMGTAGRTSTLGPRELGNHTVKAGSIRLPQEGRGNDRRFQQMVMRQLRNLPPAGPANKRPVKPLQVDHPVAACPDAGTHLTWLRKARRTERRIEQLRAELRREGVGLLAEFRAIESLLTQWGYLDGWALTVRGDRLRFLYNESDLLLAESLDRGLFWSLAPAELAALASCFVYEPRTDQPSQPVWPTATLEQRFGVLSKLSDELSDAERSHRLPVSRVPDPGFVPAAFAWASGKELDDLPGERMAAGDFVRVSRQLVDLVRQLRDASPEIAHDASEALKAVDRGVVAAMGAG
jgi:ATP-dependent RNA helicase HelY